MPDEKTTEEIVLNLKTNFAKELQRGLKQYSDFVIKIGDSSRSIESSWSNMHRTVTSQMKDMFGGTAKQVQDMVTQSRYAMKQVMTQSADLNKTYIKSFDKLTSAQDNFISKINSIERKLQSLRNMEAKSSSPKWKARADAAATELHEKSTKLKEDLAKLQSEISNEFMKKMGALSKVASKSLVESARNQLQGIKGIAADVVKQLDMVKSRFGMMDDVSKVFKFQEQFETMKTQYASLQKTLQQQRRVTSEHEKQMKKAEFAYINATDEQIKQKNLEIYKQTIANNKIIQQSYNNLTKEVYDYSKALDKTESEIQQMAGALRKSIKEGIRPQDVTAKMNKAMDLLVEYARKTGKSVSGALISNIGQTREIETALSADIRKLEEMRKKALELQKTGLVDTRAEVKRIDDVLAKYRVFWKEYKQQQSSVRSVLSTRDLPQTGTPDLSRLRKQYVDVNNELKKFGTIQANNVLEANTKVNELISIAEKYKVKRKQVNNEVLKIEKRMHQVEIAMAKTTNAELLAEYNSYYNQLKTKLGLVLKNLERPVPKLSRI